MNYTFSDKIAPLKPSAIREIFKSLGDPQMISFAAGNPAPESFPVEQMSEISAEIYRQNAAAALQYSVTEGYAPLREQVRARLAERFGIVRDNETIIVSGGQQGIDLFAKVLLNEGDAVIAENPSFIGALNAFRAYNARLVGVEQDDEGMKLDSLEAALKAEKRVKFIYTIPTFQNPSGRTSTLENRKAVLALAKKYGVLILEDNPYGELRFAGDEVPTIKSLDADGIVTYCGSFSKVLSAGMRVGFVSGPAEIVSKMVVAKQVNDVHTNIYFQMLISRFIERYGLDGQIAGIRALYREKCGRMVTALDGALSGTGAVFTRPQGGLFLWATLPEGIDNDAFVKRLLGRKVAVVPGSAFVVDQNEKSRSFRMNYSMPSFEQIEKGVAIIGETVKEMVN